MQKEIDLAEDMMNRLLEEKACVSLGQLAVNGRDLTELGYAGPAVGQILNRLLDAVVDGDAPNNREVLLQYIQKMETSK